MTSMIRWNPRAELEPMLREPFFRRFFDLFDEQETSPRAWIPALDLAEEDDRLLVSVELPGLESQDIDLNLQGDMLTIKGERKVAEQEANRRYHRREQMFGSFSRTLRLPCAVNGEKVKASMKNGVMTIVLPKAAEHVGRRISVESR
jgi:HSP20 family protein